MSFVVEAAIVAKERRKSGMRSHFVLTRTPPESRNPFRVISDPQKEAVPSRIFIVARESKRNREATSF